MTGPNRIVVKTATEYRVGSPDGEVETAETTVALRLVGFRDGHAVCESNGRRVFIRDGVPGAPVRPRPHGR